MIKNAFFLKMMKGPSNRAPEATTGSIPELLDANPSPGMAFDSIPGVLGPPIQVLDAVRKKYSFFSEYLSI